MKVRAKEKAKEKAQAKGRKERRKERERQGQEERRERKRWLVDCNVSNCGLNRFMLCIATRSSGEFLTCPTCLLVYCCGC